MRLLTRDWDGWDGEVHFSFWKSLSRIKENKNTFNSSKYLPLPGGYAVSKAELFLVRGEFFSFGGNSWDSTFCVLNTLPIHVSEALDGTFISCSYAVKQKKKIN